MKSGDHNGRKLKFPSGALWPTNVVGKMHHIKSSLGVEGSKWWRVLLPRPDLCCSPPFHPKCWCISPISCVFTSISSQWTTLTTTASASTWNTIGWSKGLGMWPPPHQGTKKKDELTTQLHCVRAEIRQWAGVYSEVTTASKTQLHSKI